MKQIVLVLSSVVVALAVRGDTVVFNTFTPSGTYNANGGQSVGSPVPGVTDEAAAQFTSKVSGNLATIDLGLTFSNRTGPGPVNVYLYGDAGGSPDNADQIFLGSGTPSDAFGSTDNSLVSFAVGAVIPITRGTTYWLVLKPAIQNKWEIWNLSNRSGLFAVSQDDSTWDPSIVTLPAFRLTASDVTSVPDSGATCPLLVACGALLIGLHRKVLRSHSTPAGI